MYSEATASIYNIHTYLLYRVSQITTYPFLFMTRTFNKMGIFMVAEPGEKGIREYHVHQLFIIFHFDIVRVIFFRKKVFQIPLSAIFKPICKTCSKKANCKKLVMVSSFLLGIVLFIILSPPVKSYVVK